MRLSLGGTKTLPELYEAAGLKFDFSGAYIQELMDFVENELKRIDERLIGDLSSKIPRKW